MLSLVASGALETIASTGVLTAGDVPWFFTVPVCCSNPAKHFMRYAAIKAGHVKGENEVFQTVLGNVFARRSSSLGIQATTNGPQSTV